MELRTIEDRLEAAKSYHRSGNLIKAEEEYRKILQEQPDNSEATHLMGLLALQMGKLDIAEHFFNTAISLDESKPEFFVNLGVVFYLKGNVEEAKRLFKKAMSMDESYIEAYANFGKILAEQGELEEARKYLVKAVNLGDQDPSTLITLAEINLRLKMYNRAELICKQIFDLGIDENQVYDILIESLIKQNKGTEAIPFLEIMIKRSKFDPKYQQMLDEIYKQTGFSDN